MSSGALAQQVVLPIPAEPEIAPATHRWNFWITGTEAAIYMAASDMMGPLTLIPFLFARAGIDSAWIGLFTLVTLLNALGNPVGSALAGGRMRKLPFCVKVGFVQRLTFLSVPLGVMLFFDRPVVLLSILVLSACVCNFIAGINGPIYQFIITNSTWESWWGRLMSLRNLLAAVGGLGATVFVWWVNRAFTAPSNYVIIGWLGVGLLFVSLWTSSRIREIPMREDRSHGPETMLVTLAKMKRILIEDRRLRWIIVGHILRSCGFLMGAYMTAVLVERCRLTDRDMWIPVLMNTLPAVAAHIGAGWIIDRWGAKPAIVLSSLLVAINSIVLIHCYHLPAFILLFISGVFGGSLITNAWPTLLTKLAPRELRPTYFSAVSVAVAPGNVLVLMAGIAMVRYTGYDYVFYLSAAGSFLSTIIFAVKLPHIRQAPAG